MLLENIEPRFCLKCGKAIRGRTDKKFCDDYCRNVYNNHIKADSNQYVRNINQILRKNRRILESVLPESRQDIKISRDQLIFLGFCFQYFTNSHTNHRGEQYFFCYDYGFRELENDKYLVLSPARSIPGSRKLNRDKTGIVH